MATATRSSRGVPRALLVAGAVAIGCSSGGATTSDAAPPARCGDAAPCAVAELCVSLQNCGATMTCTPVPDGGACPAGSTATPTCPDTGQPGCLVGCPVSYSCKARPAGCTASVDCTCAAPLCSPDRCIATMNSRVACAP